MAGPNNELGRIAGLSNQILSGEEKMKGIYGKLRHIQQIFENQVDIVRELLYVEVCDNMKRKGIWLNTDFFMIIAMDLCSCYLNFINDMLEVSNEQVNAKHVFSYFSKIKKVFDVISDSAEIRELPEALNGTIHIFCDYLNQVGNIKEELEKFMS